MRSLLLAMFIVAGLLVHAVGNAQGLAVFWILLVAYLFRGVANPQRVPAQLDPALAKQYMAIARCVGVLLLSLVVGVIIYLRFFFQFGPPG